MGAAPDHPDADGDVARTPRWPLPHRNECRDRLLAAYRSRAGYHGLRHLHEVLDRIDELGAREDLTIVLAAWFHDAVYDGAPGDEERSAALAEVELTGVPGVDVAEVARLVLLTRDHAPAPADLAGTVLCDADLAILAAPAPRYQDYVAGVRRDHAHIDDPTFRAGRLAVLEDLASREHLFGTAHARREWEPRARANLAAEIDGLRAQA